MRKVLGSVVVVMLVAATAFLVASCGATPSSTPTPATSPTAAPAAYPATVTDMMGRQVVLAREPVRIVTTHPTATEMLYRLDGSAVGRDTSSTYPPEAQSLPTVGGAYSVSIEAVAALEPDLIVVEGLTQARMLDALGQTGAPVFVVRAASLADVEASLTLLGKAIGKTAAATQAVADIRAQVDAAKETVPSSRKVLILISDAERNVYAAKADSYPGAIASILGMSNVAEGLPESGPYPGFALFSPEEAATADPDIVFAISPAPPPVPPLSTMLGAIPGFSEMDAVKNGRVKELDPVLFLQAQGPRIADAVKAMAVLVLETAP